MEDQKTGKPLDDSAIVGLFLERDERAIKELDLKYRKYLLSVARSYVRDETDCEECLDSVYVSVWNAVPPAKPAVLKAFITTLMRRTAINLFNAKKRQKRIVSEYTVSLEELEELEKTASDGKSVEEAAEEKELASIVNGYVRSLPDRQMYVFVGRYYALKPISQIAKELGVSVSTVKREIEAIKDGLRKKLESEDYVL